MCGQDGSISLTNEVERAVNQHQNEPKPTNQPKTTNQPTNQQQQQQNN